MDREAWRAAIHGVTKSRTWLSDWTELNWRNKEKKMNKCLSFPPPWEPQTPLSSGTPPGFLSTCPGTLSLGLGHLVDCWALYQFSYLTVSCEIQRVLLEVAFAWPFAESQVQSEGASIMSVLMGNRWLASSVVLWSFNFTENFLGNFKF